MRAESGRSGRVGKVGIGSTVSEKCLGSSCESSSARLGFSGLSSTEISISNDLRPP